MRLGLNIIENTMLAGIDRAILFDSGLVVSPQIASRLRSETGDALERLLKTIRYIDMRKAGEPSMSLAFRSLRAMRSQPKITYTRRRT